eukprot:maker-scaffold313_size211302-snap-gene-1.28 protein:Tk07298 transcript:maker-scaffold313_size211302-snap-gene-1.28-mRNA-1 annotation:"hypothetical protein"
MLSQLEVEMKRLKQLRKNFFCWSKPSRFKEEQETAASEKVSMLCDLSERAPLKMGPRASGLVALLTALMALGSLHVT